MTILSEAFGEGSIALQQNAKTVHQCFELAGAALVRSNRTTVNYTKAMIQVFTELGPYMVIAPNIALVHARPSEQVLSTGLALVTLTEPVAFGSSKFDPVKIVVGLSALDHDGHIDLMAALSEFLMDETKVNILLQAENEAEVRALFS